MLASGATSLLDWALGTTEKELAVAQAEQAKAQAELEKAKIEAEAPTGLAAIPVWAWALGGGLVVFLLVRRRD